MTQGLRLLTFDTVKI